MQNFRLPFQGMTAKQWQNLAIMAILIAYLIEFLQNVAWGVLCGYFGADYCAFSSAGTLANTHSYAAIYNLDLLAQIQRVNFPKTSDPSFFVVNPVPYLPIFVLPFQLFSLLKPGIGFAIWISINLIGLTLYLIDFTKKTTGHSLTKRTVVLFLISLPVFLNVMCGQVNVLLAISIGEFYKALSNKKPFIAGLWAGGLLLKPQILLLFGVALLLQRSAKLLLGLAISATTILGLSFILIGIDGSKNLLSLWLGYAQGVSTNMVEVMMNWRMIGFHIANITNNSAGSAIMIFGVILTIMGVVYLWYRPVNVSSPYFAIALLGTLAAAVSVAWHSHIHMAMVMIPLLLYAVETSTLPKRIFDWWVLLPAFVYILTMVITAFTGISANDMGPEIRYPRDFLRGFSIFVPNMVILIWAIAQIRKLRTPAN